MLHYFLNLDFRFYIYLISSANTNKTAVQCASDTQNSNASHSHFYLLGFTTERSKNLSNVLVGRKKQLFSEDLIIFKNFLGHCLILSLSIFDIIISMFDIINVNVWYYWNLCFIIDNWTVDNNLYRNQFY